MNSLEKAVGGLLLVISAPSGAGKTSICREILKMFPEMVYSVSYTTRPPRPGEVDGRDYRFISRDDFNRHDRQRGIYRME